jgi:O-antigen ligase
VTRIGQRRGLVLAAVAAWALCTALVSARMLASGWILAPEASVAIALAPLGAYAALRWPLIFPFCAYVFVMPFDTLTTLGRFGSMTKAVGLVCAAALVLRLVRSRTMVPPPKALGAWLLLLLWMFLSAAWAMESSDSAVALAQYVALLALYAIVAVMPVTAFEFDSVLGSTLVASVLAAAYGAWLFRSGQDVVASASRVIIRHGDNYIDPNNFAAALILPLAIALCWLFTARSRLLRVAMLPAIGVLVLGFATSGSRGGMLAALAMVLWLVVRARYRLWLAGVAACTVAGALLSNPGLVQRFAQTQSTDAAGRTDVWRVGLLALRDHWVVGAGVGNFPDAFDTEYLNVFARYVLGWHWAAHNTFLEIAVELGFVGLVLLVAALWVQVRTLRVVPQGHPLYDTRLALEAAFVGLLVAACSGTLLNQKYLWLCFTAIVLLRSRMVTEAWRAVSLARRAQAQRPRRRAAVA